MIIKSINIAKETIKDSLKELDIVLKNFTDVSKILTSFEIASILQLSDEYVNTDQKPDNTVIIYPIGKLREITIYVDPYQKKKDYTIKLFNNEKYFAILQIKDFEKAMIYPYSNIAKSNKTMKVYYSHPANIYNTPQEKKDIDTLKRLGFEVINPNNPKTQKDCKKILSITCDDYNIYVEKLNEIFNSLIDNCDVFAFKSSLDSTIPHKITNELKYAKKIEIPIIELPSNIIKRSC